MLKIGWRDVRRRTGGPDPTGGAGIARQIARWAEPDTDCVGEAADNFFAAPSCSKRGNGAHPIGHMRDCWPREEQLALQGSSSRSEGIDTRVQTAITMGQVAET